MIRNSMGKALGAPLGTLMCVVLIAGAAGAQDAPRVVGGRLDRRPATAGLLPALKAATEGRTGPVWIGYAVPRTGHGAMCCHESSREDYGYRCSGCRLEGHGGFTLEPAAGSGVVVLDPPNRLMVLLRMEGGRVGAVRALSLDCAIDPGGTPLVWLEGVRPAESLSYLESVAGRDEAQARREEDGAILAIAHHDDAGADGALDRLASPGQPPHRRKQAAFWMGQVRGRRGYDSLKRLLASDTDDGFREHVIFALSESGVPDSLDAIIEVARHDHSSRVRGQALFWLSQKAGRKAAAAITDALRDDPETGIKKKAVFALSQLPKDQGVPLLIETARTHRNPAIRKDAMFWLGQSNDPRALRFFEQILAK
jgi:hypothetical protein